MQDFHVKQLRMKHCYLQSKQFEYFDSKLLGQVRLAVFWGAVEIFKPQRWLSPLKRMADMLMHGIMVLLFFWSYKEALLSQIVHTEEIFQ